MSRRRLIQAAVLLALGVLVVAGLIKAVHPGQVSAVLRNASWGWVLVGFGAWIIFLLVRGVRWRVILSASSPEVRLSDATAVTALGFGINSVAPFKIGDVVRLASIAMRARIGVGEAAATVVLERVLDVLALLALALAAGLIAGFGQTSQGLWSGLLVFSALAVLVALAAWWLVRHQHWALGFWDRLCLLLPPRFRGQAHDLAVSLLRGFTSLRSPRRLVITALLSLLCWGVAVFGNLCLFRAVSPQLSPVLLYLALTVFTISQAVSVTPGSVGTFEGFYFLLLRGFGARPQATVAAAAVLSHVGIIAALLLSAGVAALWLRISGRAAPVRLNRAEVGQDPA